MRDDKPWLVAHWLFRVVVAVILVLGLVPKFTGQAGELAAKLPGGTAAVLAIGAAELAAIVLMFIPRTALIGSALAAALMLGAVFSHVAGPVGMAGDFATMFAMAVIALFSAAGATAAGWKRGYRWSGCRDAGAGQPQA